MSIHKLSSDLAHQLEMLKAEKGVITIEDATGILEKCVNAFTPEGSVAERFLCEEISNIANHIKATKAEILALSPINSPANPHIGTAAVQLDAVVKATEEAAHTIMDAADKIQEVVGASTDEALKNQITEITGTIYEACNFQDLTGQRIKKVMNALDFTESKIQKLVSLFSSDGTIIHEDMAKSAPESANMLNGPQLPDKAPTQAEIDAMFGTLK